MAKSKKSKSPMPQAVAAAHEQAQPANYVSGYHYDFDADKVVSNDSASPVPAFVNHIAWEKKGNKVQGFVPALASGICMDYGSSFLTQWNSNSFCDWEPVDNNTDGKREIRLAIRYWRQDPLVSRCIGILGMLAGTFIQVNCQNEDFKQIVSNWLDAAMPHEFKAAFFLEYFRTGYVPILKTLIEYVPRDYRANKIPQVGEAGNIDSGPTVRVKATAEAREQATTELLERNKKASAAYKLAVKQYQQAVDAGVPDKIEVWAKVVAAKQYEWLKGTVPGAYTVLNPELVDMDGPADLGWMRQPFLRISGALKLAIQKPTDYQNDVMKMLPLQMVQQIRNGSNKIWLPPNICSVVTRDKQPYERYPTPMCAHAFKALEMKDELYHMDRATVHGVRNRILLVKIGNDEYPCFDPTQIAEVQKLFNSPSRTMTLFWNHTIELEWIEPALDSLKDTTKYKIWDDQIRTAFGISSVLSGTSETAGVIGNSIFNFKGVEAEVASAQQSFLQFANHEIKLLRTSLGISDDVHISFDELNLKDEVAFMAALTQMVMNGIIDHQTALETLQFHFPTITERMKQMKSLKGKGLFMPVPSANNLGPGGNMLPAKGGLPGKGRPKKSPGKKNQSKTGKSPAKKAKATARLIPISDREAVFVVDADLLTPEETQEISQATQVPTEWIMTKASYEERYGKPVDFTPPWPFLTQAETFAAIRESNKLLDQAKAMATDAIDKQKSGTSTEPGKRGPYITAKKRDDAVHHGFGQAFAGAYGSSENFIELIHSDKWTETVDQVKRELQTAAPDMSDIELAAAAQVITYRRARKVAKKPMMKK
jgi:hypothetical protein